MTTPLFRDDAYLQTSEASVTSINDRGGIILDKSIFYPTSGGQPGDGGHLGGPILVGEDVLEIF